MLTADEKLTMVEAARLDIDLWKIRVDRWKGQADVWKGTVAMTVENLKVTAEYGRMAITNAVLINGAAALGLLTFLGNAYTRAEGPRAQIFALLHMPIIAFSGGVLLAGLGAGAASIGMGNATILKLKRGRVWGHVARWLIVGSFVAFCSGVGLTFQAFRNLPLN